MHPIFDGIKLKWTDPNVRQLHKLLGKLKKFKSLEGIELWYEMAGDELPGLTYTKTPAGIWKEALDNLHANGCLRVFCQSLLDEGKPPELMQALKGIFETESVTESKFIDESPLMDRKNLRSKLNALASPESNTRVLIVRGDKRTGKSHGRLLFVKLARDNGGTIISMKKPQITVLADVLNSLFGPLGGLPENVRKKLDGLENRNDADTTDFAWLDEVSRTFLNAARAANANLWIAMDNLGKEQDAFLLPQEIKLFFDKLVLQMSTLSYLDNVRLMLIDYPDGDTPPGWEEIMWQEDRTRHDDVVQSHVIETIESWCRAQNKNLHKDTILEQASAIIKKAERTVAEGIAGKPAYRIEQIDKCLRQYLQTL